MIFFFKISKLVSSEKKMHNFCPLFSVKLCSVYGNTFFKKYFSLSVETPLFINTQLESYAQNSDKALYTLSSLTNNFVC